MYGTKTILTRSATANVSCVSIRCRPCKIFSHIQFDHNAKFGCYFPYCARMQKVPALLGRWDLPSWDAGTPPSWDAGTCPLGTLGPCPLGTPGPCPLGTLGPAPLGRWDPPSWDEGVADALETRYSPNVL